MTSLTSISLAVTILIFVLDYKHNVTELKERLAVLEATSRDIPKQADLKLFVRDMQHSLRLTLLKRTIQSNSTQEREAMFYLLWARIVMDMTYPCMIQNLRIQVSPRRCDEYWDECLTPTERTEYDQDLSDLVMALSTTGVPSFERCVLGTEEFHTLLERIMIPYLYRIPDWSVTGIVSRFEKVYPFMAGKRLFTAPESVTDVHRFTESMRMLLDLVEPDVPDRYIRMRDAIRKNNRYMTQMAWNEIVRTAPISMFTEVQRQLDAYQAEL